MTEKVKDTVDRIMEFLERFGLPTLGLIAVGYFGFTLVIGPLAKTYQESISQVAKTAEKLEQAVEDNQAEDGERVKEIVNAMKTLEAKIDAALLRITQ